MYGYSNGAVVKERDVKFLAGLLSHRAARCTYAFLPRNSQLDSETSETRTPAFHRRRCRHTYTHKHTRAGHRTAAIAAK